MKFSIYLVAFSVIVPWAQTPKTVDQSPEVVAARKARDRGSVEELQKAIAKLKGEADKKKSLTAYLQLALFNVWLCEAAADNQNDAVSKDAAEAGVAAAEKALAIDPQSSEAHQLLGDLLNQLIPHVFGGGMKYGKRATDEMDRALELNPKNVDAYVSRAISYYYTPESFGGSKAKALEMLKKAVEINPAEDSPHIWLATFYLEDGKQADALREINLARSTNPDRAFTKFVYDMVTSSKKPNWKEVHKPMNPSSGRSVDFIKWFFGIGVVATLAAITSQSLGLFKSKSFAQPSASQKTQPQADDRFDALVRNDFFAGMMGDEARLDHGMKFCEDILAKNPKHAEALVWHGGGLLTRATQAYRRGDNKLGDSLWKRGLEEMDQAVAFEPNHMGVKIGRSATLIGLAQAGWDSSDTSKALLLSALKDYERVYEWQKPFFAKIGIHSRGELLFGLASGWSILGEREKTVKYLKLILEDCAGTNYEREARRWLAATRPSVVQHDCTGCHVSH